MKDNILVSIITVVYNDVETIERTIESVINQSYSNIEYIIVDGGSTDGTIDVIKRHSNEIDSIVSEEDEGIYDAMNKGIKMSSGELIGMINSDDWYEYDSVENIVSTYLEEGRGPMLLHGAERVFRSDGKYDCVYGNMTSMPTLLAMPFHHPTCFVHRDVYKDIGIYDRSFPVVADYDFAIRFIKSNHKDVYIDRIISNFTLGGTSSNSVYCEQWEMFRKNGYSLIYCSVALAFRIFRENISSIMRGVGLGWILNIFRNVSPYHRRN